MNSMTLALKRAALFGAALMLSAVAVQAEVGIAKAPNGMTLYIFDKDTKGNVASNDKGIESDCYDACAAKWPPFLVVEGETMGGGWTKFQRHDGPMQWAYGGRPAYFFSGDTMQGQKKGDGVEGNWHVIN
jgi:predicted lipoprotein with Yx(FWY)xxD motif